MDGQADPRVLEKHRALERARARTYPNVPFRYKQIVATVNDSEITHYLAIKQMKRKCLLEDTVEKRRQKDERGREMLPWFLCRPKTLSRSRTVLNGEGSTGRTLSIFYTYCSPFI